MKSYKNIIYEGAQGLLLDQNIGFFPNVTRSNTGMKNFENIDNHTWNIYYIIRAYHTRHGNGPMTHNQNKHIKNNPCEQNFDSHAFQGIFKKGILDISLLQYAITKDLQYTKSKNINLVITCLDLLTDYKYIYNDKEYTFESEYDFIRSISDIMCIRNIYTSKTPIIEKFDFFKF